MKIKDIPAIYLNEFEVVKCIKKNRYTVTWKPFPFFRKDIENFENKNIEDISFPMARIEFKANTEKSIYSSHFIMQQDLVYAIKNKLNLYNIIREIEIENKFPERVEEYLNEIEKNKQIQLSLF